jgi:hypothetical protein
VKRILAGDLAPIMQQVEAAKAAQGYIRKARLKRPRREPEVRQWLRRHKLVT